MEEKDKEKSRAAGRKSYYKFKALPKVIPICAVCTKCGEEKPSGDFYKSCSNRNGLNGWCKKCLRKQIKEWKRRNPDKVRKSSTEASRRKRLKPEVLYKKYKHEARKYGRLFTLTLEDFTNLVTSPCYYSGHKPSEKSLNGVDRMDNKKGYTPDNCLPCCGLCNRAKRDMNVDDFIEWAKAFRWIDPWSRL